MTVVIGNITKTVPIAGGVNEIIVPGVPAGEYNVTVEYNGDDKYDPVNTTEKLTVNKVNKTTEVVQVIDQGNGTVVVVVPGNATGNVTVKLGNDTYNATVINGTAVVNMTNATPGKQNITVIYTGDDGNSVELNTTVNIPKHLTPISIEVKDSYVGNFTRVVVSVPANITGNVTIEIDGENYTAKADDGIAIFDIGGLTAGDKTVTATYAGDDEYLFNSTTKQFSVFKNNAAFTVKASVSEDGRSAVIKVSGLPSDAKGYVILDVNGTEYGINITSSKQVTIPIIKSGKLHSQCKIPW